MRSQLAIFLLIASAASATAAITIISDDFSSYGAGTNLGASSNWNAKWAAGTNQQNLASTTIDAACLDLSVAERNYRVINSTGILLDSTFPTGTISADFVLDYNGLSPALTPVNQSAIGLVLTDQPQWWNGSNVGTYLSNRSNVATNSAMGTTSPGPTTFIEGWMPFGTVGLTPGTAGSTVPITIELNLFDNGTTVEATPTIYRNGVFAYTGTTYDTGFTSGTTIYGGIDTGWNNHDTPVDDFSGFGKATFDNFTITIVPEPSRATLLGAAGLLIALRRRRG